MRHVKISELVLSPASFLGLDTQEVAAALLVNLNSSPTSAEVLYSYKDPIGRVHYNQFFDFLTHNPPYGSRMDEVTSALKEAWANLQRFELPVTRARQFTGGTGALIPAGDGLFFLSRCAKRFKTITHFQNFRSWHGGHWGHGLFEDEKIFVFVLGSPDLRMAEELIRSCEHCNLGGRRLPFDLILDKVTGDPSAYYYLESPAKCPNCRSDIVLNTLVEPV